MGFVSSAGCPSEPLKEQNINNSVTKNLPHNKDRFFRGRIRKGRGRGKTGNYVTGVGGSSVKHFFPSSEFPHPKCGNREVVSDTFLVFSVNGKRKFQLRSSSSSLEWTKVDTTHVGSRKKMKASQAHTYFPPFFSFPPCGFSEGPKITSFKNSVWLFSPCFLKLKEKIINLGKQRQGEKNKKNPATTTTFDSS